MPATWRETAETARASLLSPSGEVVLTGNTAMEHSQIEEAIAEFVKKGSSAPKGSDESVAKIYRELDKGNYVKARAEAQKVAAKGAKEPALQGLEAPIPLAGTLLPVARLLPESRADGTALRRALRDRLGLGPPAYLRTHALLI